MEDLKKFLKSITLQAVTHTADKCACPKVRGLCSVDPCWVQTRSIVGVQSEHPLAFHWDAEQVQPCLCSFWWRLRRSFADTPVWLPSTPINQKRVLLGKWQEAKEQQHHYFCTRQSVIKNWRQKRRPEGFSLTGVAWCSSRFTSSVVVHVWQIAKRFCYFTQANGDVTAELPDLGVLGSDFPWLL